MNKLGVKRLFSVCMKKLEEENQTFRKQGFIIFSAFSFGIATGGYFNKKMNKKMEENIISQQKEMIKDAYLKNSELREEVELLNKKIDNEGKDKLIRITAYMYLSFVIGCCFNRRYNINLKS